MRDFLEIDQGESSNWGTAVFYQRERLAADTEEPIVQYRISMNNLVDGGVDGYKEIYTVWLYDEIETCSQTDLCEDNWSSWLEYRDFFPLAYDTYADENLRLKVTGEMPKTDYLKTVTYEEIRWD